MTLTEGEERSLAYLNYPLKPTVLPATEALDEGTLLYNGRDCIYKISSQESAVISPANQFDLVGATMFGLNDALTKVEKGASLRDEFIPEFEYFVQSEQTGKPYGNFVYYPANHDLVRCAPAKWHRLALVTSISSLYLDQERKMDWNEVRGIFDRIVVAVAGASVGSNIARAVVMDLRPERLKIADPHFFKVSNGNRVWLSYKDIVWSNAWKESLFSPWGLKNKAIGIAENIHQADPYMDIWCYYDGINKSCLTTFIGGNSIEPSADIVVEETDDPQIKILIRQEARKLKKRLLMVTDIGSAVQIDIRPFDTDPSATLAFGISDEELLNREDQLQHNPSQETFLKLVSCLIGNQFKTRGEFGDLMTGKLQRWTASIPQLGSTAAVASMSAEMIARWALGYLYRERTILDKRDMSLIVDGDLV